MKLRDAQKELSAKGVVLKKTEDGEHRVNFKKGREETAYYTNDLHDAHSTGMHHYATPEAQMKEHEHPYWKKS